VGATLVACGAEESERWYREGQKLVLPLRRFGAPARQSSSPR
jgi:hypothetical protein